MTSLNNIVDELEHSINEDVGKLIVRQLFDKVSKKDLPMKTHLTDNEVKLLTAMLIVSEKSKIAVIGEVCHLFMKLRISHERAGRKELIDAMKQIADNKTGARAMSAFGAMPQRGVV